MQHRAPRGIRMSNISPSYSITIQCSYDSPLISYQWFITVATCQIYTSIFITGFTVRQLRVIYTGGTLPTLESLSRLPCSEISPLSCGEGSRSQWLGKPPLSISRSCNLGTERTNVPLHVRTSWVLATPSRPGNSRVTTPSGQLIRGRGTSRSKTREHFHELRLPSPSLHVGKLRIYPSDQRWGGLATKLHRSTGNTGSHDRDVETRVTSVIFWDIFVSKSPEVLRSSTGPSQSTRNSGPWSKQNEKVAAENHPLGYTNILR